jgi:hypothetical protein
VFELLPAQNHLIHGIRQQSEFLRPLCRDTLPGDSLPHALHRRGHAGHMATYRTVMTDHDHQKEDQREHANRRGTLPTNTRQIGRERGNVPGHLQKTDDAAPGVA